MTAAADRHLLFGLLALQNGIISQVPVRAPRRIAKVVRDPGGPVSRRRDPAEAGPRDPRRSDGFVSRCAHPIRHRRVAAGHGPRRGNSATRPSLSCRLWPRSSRRSLTTAREWASVCCDRARSGWPREILRARPVTRGGPSLSTRTCRPARERRRCSTPAAMRCCRRSRA